MSNSTSAECPSADTRSAFPAASGDSTFMTFGCDSSLRVTSCTTARNSALDATADALCTSTSSLPGCLNPLFRIRWASPDSPGPVAVRERDFVPTIPPIANATTTNASQPKTAFFQCRALHRPTRAARFSRFAETDMLPSLSLLAPRPTLRTISWPPGPRYALEVIRSSREVIWSRESKGLRAKRKAPSTRVSLAALSARLALEHARCSRRPGHQLDPSAGRRRGRRARRGSCTPNADHAARGGCRRAAQALAVAGRAGTERAL